MRTIHLTGTVTRPGLPFLFAPGFAPGQLIGDGDAGFWLDLVNLEGVIPATGGVDVFGCMGQSNWPSAADATLQDWADNPWPAATFSYASGFGYSPAAHPIRHSNVVAETDGGSFDLSYQFAVAHRAMFPDRTLVLVHEARGGTGFTSPAHNWTKDSGGLLYANAVTSMNLILSDFPGATLRGFLWHQGEYSEDHTAYAAQLDGFIANLRADVTGATATTPFILGGLAPENIALGGGGLPERQAIIEATPTRVAHTGYVSSVGLTTTDTVHFDQASKITFGQRYHDKWAEVAGV